MADFEHAILTKTRKLVDADQDYLELKSANWMKFFYGEQPSAKFALVINTDGDAYAINASDTFEISGDIDKIHTQIVGTTAAAYSGAVTAIALTLSAAPSKKTGSLILKNDSGERERVDYTDYSESGGTYTFTVSKTLDYSYDSGDYGAVEDPLMFYSDDVTINTTDSTIEFTGINCFNDTFLEKFEADGGDPVEIWVEVKRHVVGEDNPRILLQTKAYASGPVRDIEGEGNSSTSVLAALDARFLARPSSTTQDNFASFDAAGQVEDSGVAKSAVGDKADKVSGATAGNFAGLDANGNLTDSGKKPADYVEATEKGTANGVAELDASGTVPSAQLPGFVDDVLEYADLASFPGTGETGKIYVALDTNLTYRWSGSAYVEISSSLALGETSSTAYRGDRGKTAYDHSQTTSGNPHNVTKSDVGLGNVTNILNKLDATTAPTASDDSGDGYSVGSVWVDVTNDKAYICLDSTASAAVWTETTQAASSLALNDLTDVTAPSPSSGQYLKWNGSAWEPDTPSGSGDMTKAVYDTNNKETDIFEYAVEMAVALG